MKTLMTLPAALTVFAASAALSLPPPDPLTTPPGTDPGGTVIRLGTGGLPPLPADFFGPGSDPFDGIIALRPESLNGPQTGDASALLQRADHPIDPTQPVGSTGVIPIEIVALSLVSTEPIVVTYFGGLDPEEWDLRVELSVNSPPPGTMTATKTHANGGTYEADFPIQPTLVFHRRPDGAPAILDTGLASIFPLQLVAVDGNWVHLVAPKLELIAPSNGAFVPGVDEVVPGVPSSQCPTRLHAVDITGAMDLTLTPAMATPAGDPWVTVPGIEMDGTYLEFGAGNCPPVPADFFGPGSDPFEGQVALTGESLGSAWGETLVERFTNPFAPCEAPSTDARTIPIEIVALDLRSVEPIPVTYGGLFPELWDLRVEPHPTSPGDIATLRASKTHDNGGTFHSTLPVQPIYVFTRVAGSDTRVLDSLLEGLPPLVFHGTDGHWVHAVEAILDVVAPSNGKFVPGVEQIVPRGGVPQVVRPLHLIEVSGAGAHTLTPLVSPLTDAPGRPRWGVRVVAFPNPFRHSTALRYDVPRAPWLTVDIYDVRGRWVRDLRGPAAGGTGSVTWDGLDATGVAVAPGVYFFAARTVSGLTVGKVARLR